MDVRLVRGNTSYGQNAYVDNGNGTITDNATGLMWLQADSGSAMSWQDALAYAEASTASGYSDWRLPNAKELQSIVDYTRSPDTTGTAAIDPLFKATNIGTSSAPEYGFYWERHQPCGKTARATAAVTWRLPRAGLMQQKDGSYKLMDAGAGAQRSDPKPATPATTAWFWPARRRDPHQQYGAAGARRQQHQQRQHPNQSLTGTSGNDSFYRRHRQRHH